MNRMFVLAAVVLAASAAGCSSARYVHRGADEGEIAIPDQSNSWPTYNKDKATNLIKEHVGPDYEIIGERVEKSGGQPPPGNGLNPTRDPSTNNQLFFLPNDTRPRTTGNDDTAQATEVRIRYRRRSVGASGWLPGATSTTTAAGLPTLAGPGAGAKTTLSPGVIPAGLQTNGVQPLIMRAEATSPAPTNPASAIPPPILPAGGFPQGTR